MVPVTTQSPADDDSSRSRVSAPADIGEVVRRARRSQGLTQAELAGACGTGVRFIVELEGGKPTCQIGKALAVLKMLGLNLWLVGRDHEL